jgi:hypothetical protein
MVHVMDGVTLQRQREWWDSQGQSSGKMKQISRVHHFLRILMLEQHYEKNIHRRKCISRFLSHKIIKAFTPDNK